MKKNITQLTLAITAAMSITACGSSNNDNNSKPSGPITSGNARTYINLALTALPSLSTAPADFTMPADVVAGMPIGHGNITTSDGQSTTGSDNSTILKKLCEDGSGKLTQTTLKTTAFEVTEGDYDREDYEACTFDSFEHDGSLQMMVDVREDYVRMDDSEDPFTESKTVRIYSYDGYTVNNISSDDNIAVDGELTVEQEVESTPDFLDPTKRKTVTLTNITADLYSINIDVVDQPNVHYTFKDFTFAADEDSLKLDGNVEVKNGNQEYTYTVKTPAALNVTYAEEDADTNTVRAINSYKGNMVITEDISTLKIVFNGDSADISLDVDNDGAIDHTDTVALTVQ
ncbi:hypothetical protein [Marinagarivorans algicola]|uniref:hypothetical protein n=1 Tax=Marinagarivorans algicola TaxID=1513270 RepID=UPI0006B97D3C|nr:hypothetical protein [Marinagarivorans algicola]